VYLGLVWGNRRLVARAPAPRSRTAGRRVVFRGYAFPGAGFLQRLPDAVSYVGRPFPVSRQRRADRRCWSPRLPRSCAAWASAGCPARRCSRSAVLALLGSTTWRRAADYTHIEGLWRDTLAKNPDAWIAHINLANILSKRDEVADAVDHYKQALRLKPDEASPTTTAPRPSSCWTALPEAARARSRSRATRAALAECAFDPGDRAGPCPTNPRSRPALSPRC